MTEPHALVTGAAGFIGSHLVERLLAAGARVTGVDAFTDYYDPAVKRANLAAALADPRFRLLELDLGRDDLAGAARGGRGVPPGRAARRAGLVGRASSPRTRTTTCWRRSGCSSATGTAGCERFVYASSSSVYGDAERYPTAEDALPRPFSPYGVTKLAGEHLVLLYGRNFGVPAVALRYFTVYGPRQRPDMAFHRFCRAMLRGEPITVYGDGAQSRDFTFVADAVEATFLAWERGGGPARLQRGRRLAGRGARGGRAARARARGEGGRPPRAGPAGRPAAHARRRDAARARRWAWRLRSASSRGWRRRPRGPARSTGRHEDEHADDGGGRRRAAGSASRRWSRPGTRPRACPSCSASSRRRSTASAGRGRSSTSTTARATARTRWSARLAAADPRVRGVSFRGNYGKAAALATGFRLARGEWVADAGRRPAGRPGRAAALVGALEGGLDLVSGWKAEAAGPVHQDACPRRCSTWSPPGSWACSLHDFNCGFKLYRREVTEAIEVYGELHRFLPALAHWQGFRVGEVAVHHRARRHGRSKFGAARFVNGFLDLLVGGVHLDQRAQAAARLRPHRRAVPAGGRRHLALVRRAVADRRADAHAPAHADRRLVLLTGIQFILMGLLGEMIAAHAGALRLPGAPPLQPGRPGMKAFDPGGRARHAVAAALRRPAQAAGAAGRAAVPGPPARVAGRRRRARRGALRRLRRRRRCARRSATARRWA